MRIVMPAVLACLLAAPLAIAEKPSRLGNRERAALGALLDAVDRAQHGGGLPPADVESSEHVLMGGQRLGYVPISIAMNGPLAPVTSAALYIRAVRRHGGPAPIGEHSAVRDYLAKGAGVPPRTEVVGIGAGEMPVGGPGTHMGSRAQQAVQGASTALALQSRTVEKQQSQAAARDPLLYPYEDYDFVELKPLSANEPRTLARALALPPGAYDVYVAVLDRSQKNAQPVVVRRSVVVPDFWNRELALSSPILVEDVRTLGAPRPPAEQREHPFTFGTFELVPVSNGWFTTAEVLSVVFQICNYTAPDADLLIEYDFYRQAGGSRAFFNRTAPQRLHDADLPPAAGPDRATFAMQSVPLASFPPGQYELEVTVRDFKKVGAAKAVVTFTIIGQ